MTSYAEHFAEDRRLSMLKVLEFAPHYTANEYLVQSALRGHGHAVGLDRVRSDIAWLTEQGLLTSEQADGMHVLTLTTRGVEVARGEVIQPGVKRPLPGA